MNVHGGEEVQLQAVLILAQDRDEWSEWSASPPERVPSTH